MVKIHQHIKFQANPSMHSPANARKPLRTDGRTDGRTDRRTDGRTDGRTCRKTVTVGRVDQRTHVQVKRGYFRLRTDGRTDGQTDGRTDGQPENIMPPAPKGGGIKIGHVWKLICAYMGNCPMYNMMLLMLLRIRCIQIYFKIMHIPGKCRAHGIYVVNTWYLRRK